MMVNNDAVHYSTMNHRTNQADQDDASKPETFRETLNPWMTASGPSAFSQMSNTGYANTQYKPAAAGNTTLYANIPPKTAPLGWKNQIHPSGSCSSLNSKPKKREIDKSVKDLLNNDLSGLQNDYS